MNCIWLNSAQDVASTIEVEGSGTAGAPTITLVLGGASYGNSSSGLIWSLLTNANEVVEIISVVGNVLTLNKPLAFDCIRVRYSYLDDGYNYKRICRIMPTGVSDSFGTTVTADEEGIDVEDFGDKYPTCFFEKDISVGQSITITGILTADTHTSAKQYKDSLWNLIRGGWVHILWGVNRNLRWGFLIKKVKVTRKATQPYMATGQSTFSTNKYDVQLNLEYAEFKETEGSDNFDQSGEMIGELE